MNTYKPTLKQSVDESKFEDEKHMFYYHRKITNKWVEKGYKKVDCYNVSDKYGVLNELLHKKYVMFLDDKYNIYRGLVRYSTPIETDNQTTFETRIYMENPYTNEKVFLDDDEVFNFEELKMLNRNRYEIRGFYVINNDDDSSKKKSKSKK